MEFPDFYKKNVEQTGRSFHVRFSEHFLDYEYGSNKSKFAQHLLESRHSTGPIENVMKVLYRSNKGKILWKDFIFTKKQILINKLMTKTLQIPTSFSKQ